MQDLQAKTEAWQLQMAEKTEGNARLIADLQPKAKKDSPRHKLPKTDGARKVADDMDLGGFTTPFGPSSLVSRTPPRQAGFRPLASFSSSAGRPPRAGSAPPPRTAPGAADDDEHLILAKLPEPVHEKMVHLWWCSTDKHLPTGLAPTEVVVRPFHDYVMLFWAFAQDANQASAALRSYRLKLTTRDGVEKDIIIIIIIRDRPPPIQRSGRGIHPYYAALLENALQGGEETKRLHRGRGRIPYSTFHTVNPITGDARLLLTLRCKDMEPGATAIVITEVVPDDGLSDAIKQKLKALFSP